MNAYFITTVFLLLYYAPTLWLVRDFKLQTRDLCICGIGVALTLILEVIRIPLPTGASLSPGSVIPFMLLAIIYDYRMVFLSGWVCGIMALLIVPVWQPVHWAQIFVEHMICFSCLGYAGVFGNNKRWKILLGVCLAFLIKLLGHFLSGVIFFSQNAWEGWGAWAYSLGYNLSSSIPQVILSSAVLLSLPLNHLKAIVRKEQAI